MDCIAIRCIQIYKTKIQTGAIKNNMSKKNRHQRVQEEAGWRDKLVKLTIQTQFQIELQKPFKEWNTIFSAAIMS